MSCQFVREHISGYLDQRLAGPDRRSVDTHLGSCGECAALHRRTAQVRESLGSLPAAVAPSKLRTDLLVMASKEVVRRRHRGTFRGALRALEASARLLMDNLMRPLAVPFAGGLTSALFLFGMLVPYLGVLRNPAHDRPTALYTEA